jgi:hypothetical protein
VNLFALFDSARTRLQVIPREGLGELVQPARILGIPRAPRIVSRGWVWHLGAILLSEDDVYATGDIIRAHQEVRRGYPAESQRRRAELAAAARRGGFAEGQTVHLGWTRIDLAAVGEGEASGPLTLAAGVPSIRWSPRGGFVPLEPYIEERISLLLHPPLGMGESPH